MIQLYLGIDFGTSGARAIVIDAGQTIQAQASLPFQSSHSQQTTDIEDDIGDIWQQTLFDLIAQIPANLRQAIEAIAINGTSATVLVCDEQGQLLEAPLFYNDDRGTAVLEQVRAIAPPNHTVVSATSSLAKLLWFVEKRQKDQSENQLNLTPKIQNLNSAQFYFLHQADWLSFLLHGRLGISDYHNALKLGYDVGKLRYPAWLLKVQTLFQLPQVVAPGTPIALVQADIAARFGFSSECMVCAGTTDSIAAFLASGANAPGEAVTSLGSTLVLKLLSNTRVDDAQYGIYSHRFGNLWLVGGASNTGGAVLRQFFTHEQLQQYSDQIAVDRPSPLAYYPLLKPGERFPINDPALPPCLDPRPDNPIEFLHGLLESVARIEASGYELLQGLGATPLTTVYTAGGGAQNAAWGKIRSRHLQVPVIPSVHVEAAYGTALLAKAYNSF